MKENNLSICGADCTVCPMQGECNGCKKTDGAPFGIPCMVAKHCKNGSLCALKTQLITAFRSQGIEALSGLNELFALRGAFVNLEYTLANGSKVQLLEDNKIYLGNQLDGENGRCYGLAADEEYLLICSYGENGVNPEIEVYRKWR